MFIFTIGTVLSKAQSSKVNPFVSIGSSGIGFGLNYKSYSMYCRYFYVYEDDPTYYSTIIFLPYK